MKYSQKQSHINEKTLSQLKLITLQSRVAPLKKLRNTPAFLHVVKINLSYFIASLNPTWGNTDAHFSSSGYLKDVTGNYVASFIVAGTFPILGIAIMTTLPHYFSCEDPPPPQGRPPKDPGEGIRSEMEQMTSRTSTNAV